MVSQSLAACSFNCWVDKFVARWFLAEDKSKTARKKANETILPVFTPLSRLSPSRSLYPRERNSSMLIVFLYFSLLLLLLLLRCLPISCFLHLGCELATTVLPFSPLSLFTNFFSRLVRFPLSKDCEKSRNGNESRTWSIILFFFSFMR